MDKQREKAKLELEMKLKVTLKQIIPALEATREGPLGVILSQFYINANEFCLDFNKKTVEWMPGVLLPTKITKTLRAKEYNINIGSPTIPTLIEAAIDDELNYLDAITLYDAIKFKSNYLKKPIKPITNLFFSSLKAKHIRKINLR